MEKGVIKANLLVFQIKFQKFILTFLHHAGQTLQILYKLTIESKNLKMHTKATFNTLAISSTIKLPTASAMRNNKPGYWQCLHIQCWYQLLAPWTINKNEGNKCQKQSCHVTVTPSFILGGNGEGSKGEKENLRYHHKLLIWWLWQRMQQLVQKLHWSFKFIFLPIL